MITAMPAPQEESQLQLERTDALPNNTSPRNWLPMPTPASPFRLSSRSCLPASACTFRLHVNRGLDVASVWLAGCFPPSCGWPASRA